MRLSPLFTPFGPFALVALASLAGCGGNSVGVSLPDGSTSQSGEEGGTQDSSPTEASTSDDGGQSPIEGSTSDDGGGADSGDASCSALATRKDCVACCDTTFAGGLSTFDGVVEECACQASLCGPLDAASGDDAGGFGTGACTASCGTTVAPGATCERCILETLGTVADAGACRAAVVSACASSAPCKRYVACTDSCPAN